jgi:hypothetical protein
VLGRPALVAQARAGGVELRGGPLGLGEPLRRPAGPDAGRVGLLHGGARLAQRRVRLLDRAGQVAHGEGRLVERPGVRVTEAADHLPRPLDLPQRPLVGRAGVRCPGTARRLVAGCGQVGLRGRIPDGRDLRPRPGQPLAAAELVGCPHGVGDGALLVVQGEKALRGGVACGERALVGGLVPPVGPAEQFAPLARWDGRNRTRKGALCAYAEITTEREHQGHRGLDG